MIAHAKKDKLNFPFKSSVAHLLRERGTFHCPRMVESVGEHIRKARKARGMTQAQLADALDVSLQSVKNWERGNAEPDRHRRLPIAELLGLDQADLVDLPSDNRVRRVPVFPSVAAGRWRQVETVERLDDLPMIRVAGLPHTRFVAVTVEGDSMSRLIPPGAVALVDVTDRELVDRGIYVFETNEGATLKRYRSNPPRLVAESLSPGHDDIFPEGSIRVFGRVKRWEITPD